MSKLVIVESPAKAKTIKKYLGSGYEVVASMGHIRDLPEKRLSVDIRHGFKPKYDIIKGKEELAEELKKRAEKSEEIFLATDPDREGEAISWHLAYLLDLPLDEKNRVTFNEITQTGVTKSFSKQIENISQSYSILSDDCLKSGQRVFKVGRYLDKTRSDLVRGCSKITQQDWMRVFEVDHYILTWRVYNNIVGFEHLLKKQVDDPSRCKLGKWIAQLKDDKIVNSSEFKQLVKAHNDLHHYAELSWHANEDGDKEKAMQYFNDTYNAFSQFDEAINKLQKKMQQLGYNDITAIVAFEK